MVVNPKDAFFTYYIASMRLTARRVAPESLLVLAGGKRAMEVERRDAQTLVVRTPMPVGSLVALHGVSIEVTRVDGGVRTEAVFTFDGPLERDELQWMEWRWETLVRFALPAIGETRRLAAQPPTL